ncbi:hypothetical protein TNCV_1376331 [Trichonephila clavipes]|nr:hypothetical protein TNCV_1376331 [Trichonephila clavipes]
MGGAGIGAFVIPPIVEILIHVYGVSGMLLIFGGMVLHSIPATMILRRADFAKKATIGEVQHCIEDGDSPQLTTVQEYTQSPNTIFSITSSIKSVEKSLQPDKSFSCAGIPENHLDSSYSINVVPFEASLVKNEKNTSFSMSKTNEQQPKLLTMNMQFSTNLQSELSKQAHKLDSPLLLNIRTVKSSVDIRDLAFDYKMKTEKVNSEKLIEH